MSEKVLQIVPRIPMPKNTGTHIQCCCIGGLVITPNGYVICPKCNGDGWYYV